MTIPTSLPDCMARDSKSLMISTKASLTLTKFANAAGLPGCLWMTANIRTKIRSDYPNNLPIWMKAVGFLLKCQADLAENNTQDLQLEVFLLFFLQRLMDFENLWRIQSCCSWSVRMARCRACCNIRPGPSSWWWSIWKLDDGMVGDTSVITELEQMFWFGHRVFWLTH